MFSEWVGTALATAKDMMIKNESLAQYVYGDNAAAEIEKLKKQVEAQKSE